MQLITADLRAGPRRPCSRAPSRHASTICRLGAIDRIEPAFGGGVLRFVAPEVGVGFAGGGGDAPKGAGVPCGVAAGVGVALAGDGVDAASGDGVASGVALTVGVELAGAGVDAA